MQTPTIGRTLRSDALGKNNETENNISKTYAQHKDVKSLASAAAELSLLQHGASKMTHLDGVVRLM